MHRSFVHLELNTDDIERARDFYREVFGWEFDEVPIDQHTYVQINTPRPPAGGIQVKPSPDLPSHWMPYIAVGDVRGAVDRALGAGARIVTDYSATPGHGAIAILRDPSGAVFGLWQVEGDGQGRWGPEPEVAETANANERAAEQQVSVAAELDDERAKADAMNERVAKKKGSSAKKKTGRKTEVTGRGKKALTPRPRLGAARLRKTPSEDDATQAEPLPPEEPVPVSKKKGGRKKKGVVAASDEREPVPVSKKKGGRKKKAATVEAPVVAAAKKKGRRKIERAPEPTPTPEPTWDDELTSALEALAAKASARQVELFGADVGSGKKKTGKKKAGKKAPVTVEPAQKPPFGRKKAGKKAPATVVDEPAQEPSFGRKKASKKAPVTVVDEPAPGRKKKQAVAIPSDDTEPTPPRKKGKKVSKTPASAASAPARVEVGEWKTSKKKSRVAKRRATTRRR